MRILVDALTAREGGGITYIRNVVPALVRAAPHHDYAVLLSRRYQCELIEQLPAGARPVVVDLAADDLLRRAWYEQSGLRTLLRSVHADLLFTVNEVGAIRPPVPHVAMGRNPNIFAPAMSWGGSARQRLQLLHYRLTRQPLAWLTLRSADRVVFVSETFRDEVTRRLGLDRAKTRVVHHGLNPNFFADGKRNGGAGEGPPPALRGRPYLLSVSTVAAHKNFETLLLGYAAVVRDARKAVPDLAIAGRIADHALRRALGAQAAALGVADRVHFLDRVPYERLPAVYRGATAFLLASRLETFGHPLVEAMASGTPVITSALPVCREICLDAALYFDPNAADELASRLDALLGDAALRERLRTAGLARARHFSWDQTARQMVGVFDDAAAGA